LPYYIPEYKTTKYQAHPQNLLITDKRDDWWQKYSSLKGKKYEGLPQSLRIESLDEITSQPILNYLVAISDYFLQNKIDESTTRNQIYQSLLEKVYERGWAERNKATGDRGHPITQSISFADFQLVLEEVGLCAWHGDGRKVSEAEIIAHCENSSKKIKVLLSYFSENINSTQARITKLLTAFYFQVRGEDLASGDKTFEFTHKSFGEFLVAKRSRRAARLERKAITKALGRSMQEWYSRFRCSGIFSPGSENQVSRSTRANWTMAGNLLQANRIFASRGSTNGRVWWAIILSNE
jgi:hypothetical protein